MLRFRFIVVALLLVGLPMVEGVHGQSVEKVVDFNFFGSDDGSGVGSYSPLDRFVQVGSNLWFTTSKGGVYDAGSICRLDLVTTTLVTVASFDNVTGKAAESPLLVISNEAFFTTVNGGTGNKGTIAKINLSNGVITVLHDFDASGIPTGATPRGGLTRIGDYLWGMTSLGGVSNRGVLYAYDLVTGATTGVVQFTGADNGGQPFDGLMQLGDAYYFTTFIGGSTFGSQGLSLGAGTLTRLDFSAGTATVTRVADMVAGHSQFPASTPVALDTNTVYFTTVGPNSTPGAIVRYQLDTGAWSNVFNFVTNAPNPVLYGRQPGYNGMTLWQDKLYFMSRQGGSNNTGVIAVYDPASNAVTKLADLTGTNGLALGSASGSLNTGTLVEWQDRFYMYYPVTTGGTNNRGTIIRVALPSPPIAADSMVDLVNGSFELTWEGGYSPFVVQQCENLLASTWTNVLTNISSRVVNLPMESSASQFRVVGSP